ncbi:MAG TPA: hypothetical protein VGG72_14005 [Bryobacteraceae bacterium]
MLASGSAANGATYLSGGLAPGSWAQVKGTLLSNVTRIWDASDFVGLGAGLPVSLSGVQVLVNDLPAAVYYVDSGQVDFQAPNGVFGAVSVQVIRDGAASNPITAAAVKNAPGIFPNVINGVNYPVAVFTDGVYVGNPAVSSAYRKAKPGDAMELYATLPAPKGIPGVTVTIGSITVAADFAGHTQYAGEFQINFTVPAQFASLVAGNYPITIAVNGVSSPSTIDTPQPGPIVPPIQH